MKNPIEDLTPEEKIVAGSFFTGLGIGLVVAGVVVAKVRYGLHIKSLDILSAGEGKPLTAIINHRSGATSILKQRLN